jgi:thiol-disulfide isomerase/thioredoxin
MARKGRERNQRRAARHNHRSSGAPRVAGLIGIVATAALFGAVLYYAIGSSEDNGAALGSADGVRIIEGSVHTVRHTNAPLPTSDNPRTDGMPTLVWFSGTWCHFCEAMSPFAHDTAQEFANDVVFVEKSIDHDRGAAGRYGVRGTPTFVLIDESGREIVRFGFQPTAIDLRDTIEAALRQS